ncbi:MAG: type I-E CRISPR-associated endoribonuclease Cas2e [Desulfobulbus sp.]|jgi:CRISPR-associated protein Cas2
MLVVVADHLPPAVRGRMKLWFVEPKPNVFVSGAQDAIGNAVVDYLFRYCPAECGLLVFRRINKPPWYEIRGIGDPKRQIITITGLQLILEKNAF